MRSSTSSERRRPRFGVLAAPVTVVTLLSGCGLFGSAPPAGGPSAAPPATQTAGSAPPPSSPADPSAPASPQPTAPTLTLAPPGTTGDPNAETTLAASFARFAEGQSGRLSVAVTAVGGSGQPVVLGELGTPVAWSTSKVPIAIAVERTQRATDLRPTMRRAITASDNAAAESLWQSLGTPDQAASATDSVLRDYGDATTRTQSRQVRPPYTAFGQTHWSLADQARFSARLPCRAEAAPVYAAMGEVIGEQRWGLGTIPETRFKGGWGPSSRGYLVRQFGVLNTPNGQVAVAVAVDAPGFAQGTATLTRTARWLQTNAGKLPAGQC